MPIHAIGRAARGAKRWWSALALLAVMLLGGGGTPAPALELAAQLAAAAAVAAWIWTREAPITALVPRGAWLLAGLIALLPLIQLVPLPPALWQAMPGREIEREALALIEATDAWRSWSMAPDRTLAALLAALPALAILIMTAAAERRERQLIVAVAALAAVLSVLLGALQISGGPGSPFRFLAPQSGGLDGFQANRNSTADLLLVGLVAFAAHLRETSARRIALPVFAGGGLIIALGIVLTGSRTGIVLLPLAILGALLALGSWVKVRFKVGVGLALAAALLGTLAAATLANNATLSRIAARFDQQQELRPDLWRDSLHVARRHFPFGVGMGNFVSAMVAGERLEIVRPTMPNRAHNEVLELAVEGGIFALLLLGAGLAVLASAMRRAWAEPPDQARALVVFASCGLVLLMLHSLVDYPLRSMALAGLGAACAGLLLDRPRGRNQPGRAGQRDDIA